MTNADTTRPFSSPPAVASVVLPCHPSSAHVARCFVRDRLRPAAGEVVEVAELLVSEVVTNAVVHARSACRLRVGPLGGGGVRVEVHDADPRLPEPDHHLDTLDGRGLFLLDELAQRWGCEPSPGGGKSVWFHVVP